MKKECKLKCWKKSGKNTWRKKGEKKIVGISKVTYSKNSYDVYSDEVGGAKAIETLVKGKNNAIRKAKSYMKKHDRC